MTKQRTLIWIHTDEPVTPEHLARRVAEACASYGALRPGESVSLPKGPRFVVTENPDAAPSSLLDILCRRQRRDTPVCPDCFVDKR